MNTQEININHQNIYCSSSFVHDQVVLICALCHIKYLFNEFYAFSCTIIQQLYLHLQIAQISPLLVERVHYLSMLSTFY